MASDDYVNVVGISPAGVVSYADPQRIEFPTLFKGENSLFHRLRNRAKTRTDRQQEADDGSPAESDEE